MQKPENFTLEFEKILFIWQIILTFQRVEITIRNFLILFLFYIVKKQFKPIKLGKLDEVDPIENRPSTPSSLPKYTYMKLVL